MGLPFVLEHCAASATQNATSQYALISLTYPSTDKHEEFTILSSEKNLLPIDIEGNTKIYN